MQNFDHLKDIEQLHGLYPGLCDDHRTFTLNIEDIVEDLGPVDAPVLVVTYKQRVSDFLRENRNVFSEERIISVNLDLQLAFAAKIEAIEQQKALIKQSLRESETLLAGRMDHNFGD